MKRFEIRTGGFSLILMLSIIIAVLFFSVTCETQILNGVQGRNIVIISGCVLLIALFISCFYYIWMNRITVFDDHIQFQYLIRGSYRNARGDILISNISCVYMGKENFVRKYLTESQKGNLNQFYRQFEHGLYSSVIRLGISYADVLVIILKNDHVVVINTKPFSQRGLQKLLREFEHFEIDVSMS